MSRILEPSTPPPPDAPLPFEAAAVSAPASSREGPFHGVVARNFMTLGAGELLARLVGFAATIYCVRQLGVDGYGVIGFAFAVTIYAAVTADLGLEQLGPREVAEGSVALGTLVSSLLLARFAASIVLALLLALIGLLFLPRPEGFVLAVYALTVLAAGANTTWVHLGLDRSATVSITRMVAETVKVAVVVAFVHGPDDVLFVPLAQVAGDGIAALLLLATLRRRGVPLQLAVDRNVVGVVLRRASPLLVTNVLSLLIYNADVVMLRIFRDRTEVGLYLAAYTLINFLGILGSVTTLSLLPSLSRLRDRPAERWSVYHTATARVVTAALPIGVGGMLLAAPILHLIFGPEYYPSASALRVVIWTIPILLLRALEQAALISVGRQDLVLRTTAVAAALNVSLNFIAIPLFGMVGAAATTVLAEIVRVVLGRRYAREAGFPATPIDRFWRPALAVTAMAAALLLLRPTSALVGVALGAAAYVLALAATGAVSIRNGALVLRI